jgi:hypothetical protein
METIVPGSENVITPSGWEPTPSNRYYYYEFLHFIPTSEKDTYWAAQCLLFNKLNSSRLLDPERVNRYRSLDRGEMDKMEYVRIIDPPTKDGGGKAAYFTSSWQSNPINLHMQNILDARLQKLPLELTVTAADEIYQLKQQKENVKIINRRMFIRLLNEFNAELGLPPLRPDEDPYKFVEKMVRKQQEGQLMTKDGGAPDTATKDIPTQLLDSIRSLIEDNEDLALFNEYIYKDGVEVACELAMSYYVTSNKVEMYADNLLKDLRNFNCTSCRFYTSVTTGRPVFRYEDPAFLFTGPFVLPDGSDCPYWWTEYDVSFGEFVREFGADLTEEQLKLVFERNRYTRGGTGGSNIAGVGSWPRWDDCTPAMRDQALIRIGYMEWQTQNMAVYSKGKIMGNDRFRKMDDKWEPPVNSPYKKEVRYYNMWYKCYYVPTFVGTSPASMTNIQTSDFDLQRQYIFKFGPLQDQYREGEDQRYSRSSLVIWRTMKASWTDIEQRYMPSINLLWQQAQNDLANVMPHGLWFSEEAFTELMQVVDEAQKDGKDSNGEAVRALKQTGYGVGKLFDQMGNRIPPFMEIKTGHLESAREKLVAIMDLYVMMTRALAFNEIEEGQAPAPRQSATGIQLAIDASHNGTYFIEKGYTDIRRELGFRLLDYCKEVVNEVGSERYQEFCDIVGKGSAWALESVKDIPYRRLGVLVEVTNSDQQQMLINQMALEMSRGANPILNPDEAIELTFIRNVKYKFVLLRLRLKKRRKELEAQAAQAAQQQQQMMQMQMEMQAQQQQIKEQGRLQEIDITNRWSERLLAIEAQLKFQSQRELKEQIKNNRIEQVEAETRIEQNAEAQAPML